MINNITVREYARLTTELVDSPSLDRATISTTAFDWLCDLSAQFSRAGAVLVQVEGRRWLKLDNYVGVIETPCGTRLEILPKHLEDSDNLPSCRNLLQRMIVAAMDLPVREVGETSLQSFGLPVSEWVMARFLESFDHLVKRGIRSDYIRVEDNQRYLRGQLDFTRQMRQPPGRQHLFHINHDIFVPNRPENRLLKSALIHVCHQTQNPSNWRVAQELRSLFNDIPLSADVAADFKQWRRDRLMAHYRTIRPWCELILYQQMPLSQIGSWHGISMLFPMEKLFERFVEANLRNVFTSDTRLLAQAKSKSLCEHEDGKIFRLQPDLLVERGAERWVLDMKWKRINAGDKSNNYNLSQSDFYQLFAYGQKYLSGKGEMTLIYPKNNNFTELLPVFKFSNDLSLWVLPFDLNCCQLIHGGKTTLPFTVQLEGKALPLNSQFVEPSSVPLVSHV